MKFYHKILRKIASTMGYTIIKTGKHAENAKYEAEINHWKKSLINYQNWYTGKIDEFYEEKTPTAEQKITKYSLEVNATLTWQKVHQRTKYLEDLQLNENAFEGKTIIDVGSGPHPSALAYKNCKIYCLDPLFPDYLKAGFPFHYYEDRVKFAYGFSENMP
ncbi:MAG: hypothetical protein DRJ01_12405, partial [Bacteroidetes bacterium]